MWRAAVRGVVATVATLGLLVSTDGAAGAAPAQPDPAGPAARPELLDRLAGAHRWQPGDDPVPPPVPPVRSAARLVDEPLRAAPLPARLPAPARYDVTLDAGLRRVGDTPVHLAAAGRKLRVEVLDRAAATRAGAAGFVFTLTADGGPDGSGSGVDLVVDYSGFKDMFGAGFGDRLRLVALPDCVLAADRGPGCETGGRVIPARNDTAADRLAATIDDLAANGTLTVGVMAGPGGELEGSGDFKATPFELSGDWQVGIGSGEFYYSYDIPVPTPPAGAAPSMVLGYSSGAVDGLTATRNTQAGQSGVGWSDFADAYVERRYTPCVEEVDVYAAIGDLCWKSDNAVLALNGTSSELVRLPNSNPKQWRLKRDPRWRVEQLTGTLANGDNDREHWRVTTPEGVQYLFGLGVNPEAGNAPTSSVYTVPVFANHSGEPCFGNVAGNIGENFCRQAWRWNLDRVVDPNGNVTTYRYSQNTNYYKAVLGFGGWQPYTRSGRLRLVEYGGNTGAFNGGTVVPPQARIDVGGAHRCETLSPDGACVAPTSPTPGTTPETRYPDVPIDQVCTSPTGAGCNNIVSPAFFTSVRYTKLTSQVWVAGAWKSVDEVALTHTFEDDGAGNKKLYLSGIQRTGRSAATPITLPGITFGLTRLDNRVVDPGSTASRMPHFRVGTVSEEFGRKITVSYGRPHPCDTTATPAGGWDNNQRNCFLQQYLPEGATDPRTGVFHKWLVLQVTVEDTTGGSPAMTTAYEYGAPAGDPNGSPFPAWHYDADAYYKNSDLQWTDWRGYGTITVTQGSARTRYRVHRGMHRDRTGTGGETTVDIKSLDGGVTARDFDWLAGRILDEANLAGDGSVVRGTLHEYQHAATIDDDAIAGNEPHPFKAAVWSAERVRTERTRRDGGGFVSTRRTTGYNGLVLFPETLYEEGRLDVTGDERCTKTGYVVDVNRWMLDVPSSRTVVSGACSSTTVLSEVEIGYDGGAVGAAPTRANPTLARVHVSGSTWAETRTTFDALGRPRVVTDPLGRATTTTHTPATGYPTSTSVTNHLGHVTRTTWFLDRLAPATRVDARGKTTSYAYDALGRSTKVWQPTEPTSGPASWEFVYTVDPAKAKPLAIRTRRLQAVSPSTVYLDSWMVYDGLVRERQAQRPSPAAGNVIVTNTTYTDRGLVGSTSLPQAVPGTPGQLLALPAGDKWNNENATAYDELGRPVWEMFFTEGTLRWLTTNTYGHDTVTIAKRTATGAVAAGEVVTTTDAYGNKTKIAEWATRGTPASAKTTMYAYDLAGRLKRITDPRGNTIDYGYDLAGRRTSMLDRDAGSWTFGYDLAGNQTSVRDARNVTTHTVYDALNRPSARHTGDPTRPLATWSYDRPGESGLLDGSVRWVRTAGEPDRAYVVDVLGYDDRSRPTGRSWVFFDVDLPGVALPEGTTYPITYQYDRADHVVQTGYPQVGDPQNGGVAAETVTTTYNALGLPVVMDGTSLPTDQDYLYFAAYDDRARPFLFGLGKEGSGVGKLWAYDADQRLARTQASAAGVMLQDRELTYEANPRGNILKRKNTINARTWMDCYGFDDRNRLVRAYSTAHVDDCAPAAAGGGDGPYDHTYAYADDGNITQRVEDGNTITYTYPAAGATSVRPHAPTHLEVPGGGDDMDYSWDGNGQMLTRVRGGTTEMFTWDVERRLEAIETRNATGSSTASFTYDADGARLVRRNVERNAAYFEGHEVAVSNGGSVTTVRTYRLNGVPIATRSASGGDDPRKDKVEYLIVDNQGSIELSARNSESTPVVDRTYDPYGGKRTGNDGLTDRGWIGEIEDRRSELNYLNNRYYDPNLYRFVSPDPLAAIDTPQSHHPYAYGLNNPVMFTDPTGLCGLWVCDQVRNANDWVNERLEPVNSGLSDLTTGASDGLTFGLFSAIADRIDPDGAANRSSFWYRLGNWSTVVGGGAGAVRGAIRRGPGFIRRILGVFRSGSDEAAEAVARPAASGAADEVAEAVTRQRPAQTRPSGGSAADEVAEAAARTPEDVIRNVDITGPYSRPASPRPAQRAAVQGRPCHTCGATDDVMRADHVEVLFERYATGQGFAGVNALEAVLPQCTACSAAQGAFYAQASRKLNVAVENLFNWMSSVSRSGA